MINNDIIITITTKIIINNDNNFMRKLPSRYVVSREDLTTIK